MSVCLSVSVFVSYGLYHGGRVCMSVCLSRCLYHRLYHGGRVCMSVCLSRCLYHIDYTMVDTPKPEDVKAKYVRAFV